MNQATFPQTVYKARRDPKHILLGAALMMIGIGVGCCAQWFSLQVSVAPRHSGYFPAMLFVIIGLYLITQAALRFPRIEITPGGIAVRGLFSTDRVTWDRIGPFEVEARPFGVYFGNDIISAQQADGGRFSLGLRWYDISAHALMMELNRCRAAAA